MRGLPTLEQFMAEAERMPGIPTAAYVRYKRIECYLRRGRRAVGTEIKTALTIANVTNKLRRNNTTFKPRHKPTGMFREFEAMVRKAALEYGYDGVYVENVHNEFLPDVLLRYGYSRINNPDTIENNFWISVKDDSP